MKRLRALLDRISLEAKTRLIVAVMIGAVLGTGGFSHLLLFSLQQDYESLYAHHTLPVIQLQDIKDAYAINVLDTLRDMEQGILRPDQAQEVVALSRVLIARHWREYRHAVLVTNDLKPTFMQIRKILERPILPMGHQGHDARLVHQTDLRIKQVDKLLFEVFVHHEPGALIESDLYPSIKSVETHLGQLISHHLESATAQRYQTQQVYHLSIQILSTLIALIVLSALAMALMIISNIRRLHRDLEGEVSAKTQELRRLNAELEKRVDKEVRSSQQKDRIMYQQSRMAAMGEMIANIAHQWRQPLNALGMLIQSFGTKSKLGTLDSLFVEKQVTNGLRIAHQMSQTIDNFRNFFHPDRQACMFRLPVATREAVSLVQETLKSDQITLTVTTRAELCLYGFENEYAQVLLNLINNSRDALIYKKENRQIRIYCTAGTINDSLSACIHVVDNGGGVPEQIIDRVFEPYFTTKHKAQGTGIGLYMSQQIIEQQMGGSLGVKNIWHRMGTPKAQRCALFTIRLPAVKRN